MVVGNLFAIEDDDSVTALLSGKVPVPVTTYFTVGTQALPARVVEKIISDEGEICPNLHYLDKSSITKTSEGVRIVALGGILDPEILGGSQSKEQYLPYHTSADAKVLHGANSADILLTSIWPSLVWNGDQQALSFDPDIVPTSDDIADLCAILKPRYHFCPSPGVFNFDRVPFFHAPPDPSSDPPVTRFVSLAPFGNTQKAKTMTAISLAPPGPIPSGSTVSPFLARSNTSRKRPTASDEGFSRFGNGYGDAGHQSYRSKGNKRQRPGPDTCFFCLASENSENHMVCSIGEESYLATAKGPLTTPTTYAEYGLDYPAHMIITPMQHVSSVSGAVMGQDDAEGTLKEMTRFRESLQAAVSNISKHKLGAVTWEINRVAGVHVHWQFLPVPAGLIKKGLVEAAFKVEAENLKLPGLVAKDFRLADEVPGDYVRIWIWFEDDEDGDDGGKINSKCLLMRFDRSVRFDLQYPRKVMAKLLKLETRTVWQECTQTVDEETNDTTKFREEAFKPWDFTLMD